MSLQSFLFKIEHAETIFEKRENIIELYHYLKLNFDGSIQHYKTILSPLYFTPNNITPEYEDELIDFINSKLLLLDIKGLKNDPIDDNQRYRDECIVYLSFPIEEIESNKFNNNISLIEEIIADNYLVLDLSLFIKNSYGDIKKENDIFNVLLLISENTDENPKLLSKKFVSMKEGLKEVYETMSELIKKEIH